MGTFQDLTQSSPRCCCGCIAAFKMTRSCSSHSANPAEIKVFPDPIAEQGGGSVTSLPLDGAETPAQEAARTGPFVRFALPHPSDTSNPFL